MTYQSTPPAVPDAPSSAPLHQTGEAFPSDRSGGLCRLPCCRATHRRGKRGLRTHAQRTCRRSMQSLVAARSRGSGGDVVAAAEPDVVIRLASRATGDRTVEAVAPMVRDNLLSAVNVTSAVVASVPCTRVVLAGSVEEPRSVVPGRGAHLLYAAAKAAGTTYATLFRDHWQLPVTVLRLAMVYGPGGPNHGRLLPHVVRSLVDGTAPQVGSGRREIDRIYIDGSRARSSAGTCAHRRHRACLRTVGMGATSPRSARVASHHRLLPMSGVGICSQHSMLRMIGWVRASTRSDTPER